MLTGNCDEECCQTVDGGWAEWRSWNSCVCDYSSGAGVKTRTRSCTDPAPFCHGSDCDGDRVEYGVCLFECCKSVHGGWTNWSSWNMCVCDYISGTGNMIRSRSCTDPAPSCHGQDCVGNILEHTSCDDQCCESVNGNWTSWGSWSMCVCDYNGGTGSHMRTRSCTDPVPSCYGSDCEGNMVEHGKCDDQCCTLVNGNWNSWGNWSTCICDYNAGTGSQMRTRSCTDPAPSCHGADCEGDMIEHGKCNDQCCTSLNGGWSEWADWGPCICESNSTSTKGVIRRDRYCTNPQPSCRGKMCDGVNTEVAKCASPTACDQDIVPVMGSYIEAEKSESLQSSDTFSSTNLPLIICGVAAIAGIVLAGMAIVAVIFLVKRKRRKQSVILDTVTPLEAAQSTPPPAVFSPVPPPETCQTSPSSAHRFDAIENDYMDFTEL